MESPDTFTIEVLYALPTGQTVLRAELEEGDTIQQAIERSGILQRHPEIDLSRNKVGVFGKVSKPDHVLQPGDRVEIYRPLIADPKQARKKRAASAEKADAGGRAQPGVTEGS